MIVFQLTLKGWRGSNVTPESEECIKWIKAPTEDHVKQWLKNQDYSSLVKEIDTNPPNHFDFDDGVDVKISSDGAYEWSDGVPQDWKAQVKAAKKSRVAKT